MTFLLFSIFETKQNFWLGLVEYIAGTFIEIEWQITLASETTTFYLAHLKKITTQEKYYYFNNLKKHKLACYTEIKNSLELFNKSMFPIEN